jgi:hypothetical protein
MSAQRVCTHPYLTRNLKMKENVCAACLHASLPDLQFKYKRKCLRCESAHILT